MPPRRGQRCKSINAGAPGVLVAAKASTPVPQGCAAATSIRPRLGGGQREGHLAGVDEQLARRQRRKARRGDVAAQAVQPARQGAPGKRPIIA
jgi:hypothetical protein